MTKVLVYTSPARGHLYPLLPTLLELQRRGHQVAVRTLAAELGRLRALGFNAEAIDPQIEAREIDDWKASSPPAALLAACRTFVDRGQHEIKDLSQAIASEQPDLLFTDINSWGAAASAEASGLPWAVFAPYFLPVQAPGAPPWGLGLAPMHGLLGRVRDSAMWSVVNALYDRALPGLNRLRAEAGVAPFRHVAEFALRPPKIIAYTAEPFEYTRAWPASICLVGPGIWEPPAAETPATDSTTVDATAVPDDQRPLVLVTCSTEFQNDGRLAQVALDALAEEPVRVVVTTASNDPNDFRAPANAIVTRFLPHGPLLRQAACVVCHGGMGITQKALAAGVPVCVVPFGRDQLEVARHVVSAEAGTQLSPKALNAKNLRNCVQSAIRCAPGAKRVADAFQQAGGAKAAADALEGLASGLVSAC